MSLKEESQRHLKLLGARAETIADAYTGSRGLLDELSVSQDILDELVQRRVANRSTLDGQARLSAHLVSHLDAAMNTVRIRHYGFDIGSVVDSIRESTSQYLKFRAINSADAQAFLDMAENSARTLSDTLQEEAAEVWNLIQGEFAVVDSLEAKITLNRARLDRTGRLISALEGLNLAEIVDLGMADRRLRPLLTMHIPEAVERSRQNLGSALIQLNQMLFRFEQIERRTALLKGYCRHLHRNPDFSPQDHTAQIVVPGLFLAIQPLVVRSNADVKTSSQRLENQLADLLNGLRTEQPLAHEGEQTDGALQEGEAQDSEVKPSPVREAVRNLYADALIKGGPLSVVSHINLSISSDAELWLMTALEEFNSMPRAHKGEFRLEYVGQPDVVFDGNFNATDLLICPR